jgi:hypothetical protein
MDVCPHTVVQIPYSAEMKHKIHSIQRLPGPQNWLLVRGNLFRFKKVRTCPEPQTEPDLRSGSGFGNFGKEPDRTEHRQHYDGFQNLKLRRKTEDNRRTSRSSDAMHRQGQGTTFRTRVRKSTEFGSTIR